jgi:hypothetical protein
MYVGMHVNELEENLIILLNYLQYVISVPTCSVITTLLFD